MGKARAAGMSYETTDFNIGTAERLSERTTMECAADQRTLGHPIFVGELVTHFREHELIDLGDEGKAYSTRNRCKSVLNKWVYLVGSL